MRKPFTKEEKQYIIDNYSKTSNKTLAIKLQRSEGVIRCFASSIKLKKEPKIKVNDVFGKLTVITKLKGGWWQCKCKCGKESKCETNTLISKHSESCGCGRIEAISSNNGYISGTWYGAIKKNARVRGLDFLVSKEYLNQLFIKQEGRCAISGLPIEIKMGRRNLETTASLDRINNELPYIEGNVQFLHKHVNYMKWTHKQGYFIELCKIIARMWN